MNEYMTEKFAVIFVHGGEKYMTMAACHLDPRLTANNDFGLMTYGDVYKLSTKNNVVHKEVVGDFEFEERVLHECLPQLQDRALEFLVKKGYARRG